MNKPKLCIIGAGLSGLYTALILEDKYDVMLLESRSRIGGRILNLGGHDMGPSWVWAHQKNILKLIDRLGLIRFEQYTKGYALYDAPDGVQRFNTPPSPISYRVEGGMSQIVWSLEKQLQIPVILNETVTSLTQIKEKIVVETTSKTYEVDKVISTLPPRLAVESITYNPSLSTSLQTQLQNIPTWMGYAVKCVIEYPEAFWRDDGLSGFAVSHVGPLGEVHDACTENKAALFGFVHSHAKMEDIEEAVIKQLIRMYGAKASHYLNIYVVDWKKEAETSTSLDAEPLREHPSYGFDATHFNGKLIFSGTESAFNEGGYLEGAINSAMHVKNML